MHLPKLISHTPDYTLLSYSGLDVTPTAICVSGKTNQADASIGATAL